MIISYRSLTDRDLLVAVAREIAAAAMHGSRRVRIDHLPATQQLNVAPADAEPLAAFSAGPVLPALPADRQHSPYTQRRAADALVKLGVYPESDR